MPRPRKPISPFRYFHSSPEVIRIAVMVYVRFFSLCAKCQDLLFEAAKDCRRPFSLNFAAI